MDTTNAVATGNDNTNSQVATAEPRGTDVQAGTANTGYSETGQGDTGQDANTANDTQTGTLAGGSGNPPQAGAPEAYDFSQSLPDGATLDETVSKEFGDICRGMNLTNEQANQMAQYGYQFANRVIEQKEAQRAETIKSWGDDARRQLGNTFDSTMAECGAGVQFIERSVPNIRQILNETGAGNRIEFIRVFSALGRAISEDHGTTAGSGSHAKNDNPYPNTDFSKYKN